jgi:hypothetical protein
MLYLVCEHNIRDYLHYTRTSNLKLDERNNRMIDDESTKDTKQNGEQSPEHTSGLGDKTPATEPKVAPAQQGVPPSTPPKDRSGDTARKNDKPGQECPKEISIRLSKDDGLGRFERRSLTLSYVSLAVLAITFLVFFFQLLESKKQTYIFRQQAAQAATDAASQIAIAKQALVDSDESFRIGAQPYVWIYGLPTYSIYKNPKDGSSQVIVDVHYFNYGKSPAISLQRSSDLEIGADALKRIHTKPLHLAKSLLPPSKEDFFSAVTPPTNSLPDILKDDAIVIVSRSQYLDMLGHRYETDFCMTRLATGAWQYCETHNEIKDCAKVTCEK